MTQITKFKPPGAVAVPARLDVKAIDELFQIIAPLWRHVTLYDSTRELPEHVEQARAFLASDDYRRAVPVIASACKPAPEKVVRSELAMMLCSWPNARDSLEIYGKNLARMVLSVAPSRYAIATACDTLIRTQKFLPTVSEVLDEIARAEEWIAMVAQRFRELPDNVERAATVLRLEAERRKPKPRPPCDCNGDPLCDRPCAEDPQ